MHYGNDHLVGSGEGKGAEEVFRQVGKHYTEMWDARSRLTYRSGSSERHL